MTRAFWHSLFALFVIVYACVIASQLGHGLASLDAHAVVKVTRELVEHHHLEVSRPPGHPTTEVYLFPGVAWLLGAVFNIHFDERTYLIAQGIVSIAALSAFYILLLRIGTPPWKALLGSICLALSPQFFFNSVDGEEFVLAILLLMLSLYLLIGGINSAPVGGRTFTAICLFALATGCRPELIFAGFLFPLYAVMHPNLNLRAAINVFVIEVLAIAVVWFPILLIGLHPPYTSGMNVYQSILGGTYRLVFQCFTLPVFTLICWVVACSFWRWRRGINQAFPENFVFVAASVTPLIFFAALFLHASKASHVLFALPFVLILAVRRSAGLLLIWTVATVIGFFVTLDIFNERQLGRPHFVAGGYFQAIRQKPFYKLGYLVDALQQCDASPTAVIADVWRWDIEYQLARRTLSAEEELHGDVPVFSVASNVASNVASAAGEWDTGKEPVPRKQCILLPRDSALHQDVLDEFAARGYALKMDATLYRTLFARYDVISPPTNKTRIGHATVQLFSIAAPCR